MVNFKLDNQKNFKISNFKAMRLIIRNTLVNLGVDLKPPTHYVGGYIGKIFDILYRWYMIYWISYGIYSTYIIYYFDGINTFRRYLCQSNMWAAQNFTKVFRNYGIFFGIKFEIHPYCTQQYFVHSHIWKLCRINDLRRRYRSNMKI